MAIDETSPTIEARLEGLTGRSALPADVVRQSIQQIQSRRTSALRQKRERQAQVARLIGAVSAPETAASEQNEMAVEAARELGTIGGPEPVIRPPVVDQIRPALWPYQITATIAPPYSYLWDETYQTGKGQGSLTLDPNAGTMELSARANFDDSGDVSVVGGFGTYFYPPVPSGTLDIWATLVATYAWKDWAVWSAASTFGAIDLFVVSFDLTGAPADGGIDQIDWLWQDTCTLSEGDGSGTEQPVQLYGRLPVDNHHQYVIWVRCEADAGSQGTGIIRTSGARGQLAATLPCIIWTFTGYGRPTGTLHP